MQIEYNQQGHSALHSNEKIWLAFGPTIIGSKTYRDLQYYNYNEI